MLIQNPTSFVIYLNLLIIHQFIHEGGCPRLDANNLDRLVRFHHHLAIVSADFLVFHTAIVRALGRPLSVSGHQRFC